jgi:hypothetical protein
MTVFEGSDSNLIRPSFFPLSLSVSMIEKSRLILDVIGAINKICCRFCVNLNHYISSIFSTPLWLRNSQISIRWSYTAIAIVSMDHTAVVSVPKCPATVAGKKPIPKRSVQKMCSRHSPGSTSKRHHRARPPWSTLHTTIL